MKRFLLSMLFVSAVTFAVKAQSPRYQEAMEKNVAILDKQSTPEELQQAANTFDRIAEAEKNQWLPYYYAAYCRVMEALGSKDPAAIDALADKALWNANKADSLSKNNSEVACIMSLIATSRINVDPMARGRKYGPVAAGYLEDAKKYNPENPRIYMLEGQSLYYTPEQFGGSKAKAKEKFELSLQKFSSFKPESNIAPHWGEEYTKGLVAKTGN